MDEDKNKIDDFPYDAVLSGADKITSDHIVEQFKSMILSDKFPAGDVYKRQVFYSVSGGLSCCP